MKVFFLSRSLVFPEELFVRSIFSLYLPAACSLPRKWHNPPVIKPNRSELDTSKFLLGTEITPSAVGKSVSRKTWEFQGRVMVIVIDPKLDSLQILHPRYRLQAEGEVSEEN